MHVYYIICTQVYLYLLMSASFCFDSRMEKRSTGNRNVKAFTYLHSALLHLRRYTFLISFRHVTQE